MNQSERTQVKKMIQDMEHDLKQYRSFKNNKGGLNQEGFELRFEYKIKDLKNLLIGFHFQK